MRFQKMNGKALAFASLIGFSTQPCLSANWLELFWPPVFAETPFDAGIKGSSAAIEKYFPYEDVYGLYLDFLADTDSSDWTEPKRVAELARLYGRQPLPGDQVSDQDTTVALHIDLYKRDDNKYTITASKDFTDLHDEGGGSGHNFLLISNVRIGRGDYKAEITATYGNEGLVGQKISFAIRVPSHK